MRGTTRGPTAAVILVARISPGKRSPVGEGVGRRGHGFRTRTGDVGAQRTPSDPDLPGPLGAPRDLRHPPLTALTALPPEHNAEQFEAHVERLVLRRRFATQNGLEPVARQRTPSFGKKGLGDHDSCLVGDPVVERTFQHLQRDRGSEPWHADHDQGGGEGEPCLLSGSRLAPARRPFREGDRRVRFSRRRQRAGSHQRHRGGEVIQKRRGGGLDPGSEEDPVAEVPRRDPEGGRQRRHAKQAGQAVPALEVDELRQGKGRRGDLATPHRGRAAEPKPLAARAQPVTHPEGPRGLSGHGPSSPAFTPISPVCQGAHKINGMIRRKILAGLLPSLLAGAIGTTPAGAVAAPLPPPVARTLQSVGAARVGLLAVDISTGVTIAAHDAEAPLAPASTMKLVSTACALDTLGPSFRFLTAILADSVPDADGTIRGSIYVRGAGDPALEPERLWAAVRELGALGVKRIAGDVVADESFFERAGRPASWPDDPRASPYNAPQGALSLAWDATEVIVLPGPRAGTPAQVATSPLRASAPLVNRALTGRSDDLSVFLADGADGRPQIVVTGTISERASPYRTWVHLGPPGPAVGDAVVELLAGAGIEVAGRARIGRTPPDAVMLLEHQSPPLGDIVARANKPSSNFVAEMLTRSLEAYDAGAPGTVTGGTRRMGACLLRWGIPVDGLVLSDGSGFSRSNRLTAEALVGTLLAARRHPAWRAEFEASLARAAEDGSLAHRLSDLRGRVRAKTGTLNGVAALAGLAVDRGGREIAFAILVNGPGAGADDVDRLVRAIVAASDLNSSPRSGPR